MNRLFIIIATVAGITCAAWAWRHSASPEPSPGRSAEESAPLPCCQKAPSRASLLQAKPASDS